MVTMETGPYMASPRCEVTNHPFDESLLVPQAAITETSTPEVQALCMTGAPTLTNAQARKCSQSQFQTRREVLRVQKE